MSSIPPTSPWRGCAACYPQPVEDELAAQFLAEMVYDFNCRNARRPLTDIRYRSSNGEEDIRRHVFRWDLTPYQEVFRNGFQARRQEGTPDELYYNLEYYVNQGGRPLDSTRPTTHAFVSTTLNSGWHPSLPRGSIETEVYRYEIYAPGGIWAAETLGDRYRYPSQDEVCFVAGIAPQYICSAQRFRLIAGDRYTRRVRVNTVIIRNGISFNPQSHPQRYINIQRPICEYIDEHGARRILTLRIHGIPRNVTSVPERRLLNVSMSDSSNTMMDWYARDVFNIEGYINAAFRSSYKNEVYLFMNNEYVLVNYAPHSVGDKVMNGPLLICHGYPSLSGTPFGEHGIDCAFGSHDKNEAFIFSGNICAHINFAPHTTDDKILKGPTTIASIFPFLIGTVFESGIDAAFEATTKYEAYIFKDNYYALINYCGSRSRLIAIRYITQGFPSLKNTVFEGGIDAAFASHYKDEAYLFKEDSYALINFAPGTTNDYIIDGLVKKILPNWPSLRTVLPRKNRGLDLHDHHNKLPDEDHYHDEL